MVRLFLFRLGSLLSLLVLLVWEAFYRQNGGNLHAGMKFTVYRETKKQLHFILFEFAIEIIFINKL